jgi:transposase
MGFRVVELPREQLVLWSQKLDDAIPPDHPVRLFDHILHSGPFVEFRRSCLVDYVLVDGRPAFDPLDLAGLYLYGMIHRIRSSRQLEAACHNRIDVMWLMKGQTPDHSTIAAFASKHPQYLHRLFRQTVRVSLKAGLVKGEHVAVDGTKLAADAGKKSVKSESHLMAQKAKLLAEAQQEAQLEAMAAACEKEWEANEHKEQGLWAEQSPSIKPVDARQIQASQRRHQQKLAKVDAALAAIQQRREQTKARSEEPKPIASTTDPEARVMKDKEGKSKPGYNAQIAVDAEAGIIVALDVNDRPEDMGQLTPMLRQVEQETGSLPRECSADSGYNNGSELKTLQEMPVIGYLPEANRNSGATRPGAEPTPAQLALQATRQGQTLSDQQWQALPRYNGKIDKSAFTYDANANAYRCPMGHSLPVLRTSRDQKAHGVVMRLQYGGISACAACPRAKDCCSNPAKGRTVNRDQYEDLRDQMQKTMSSEHGKSRYRLRGPTVEPRFGYFKRGLGIRAFLHRGLVKVKAEFSLMCAASNLKALMRDPRRLEQTLKMA